MSLARTGFNLEFEEVCSGNPLLGRASALPWDEEIFGFPVASYQIGSGDLDDNLDHQFVKCLHEWLRRREIQLCMCAIPANNSRWKLSLANAGFSFVDLALQLELNTLQTASLPSPRTVLRPAEPVDWEDIENIAERAFRHGRYHADPRFPQQLADRRYRRWIKNARAEESISNRILVMGEPGDIQGFYHATIEGDRSDLRLAALKPELQGTLLGFDLYLSVLHVLKQLGVRRVVTSISAANTPVMNVYATLGFRFVDAEIIYHWHPNTMQVQTRNLVGVVESTQK